MNVGKTVFSGSVGLTAGLVFGLTAPAAAQAVQGSTLPTRDVIEGITEDPAPLRPRLAISGGIDRSPCALADPQYADVTLTINQVIFNGLKGATPEELEPAWRIFAGTVQPLSVLCEIRDAAATILRNKGYLAAAQVPTQRIENGTVRYELIFGRITAIRARGETQGAERKLEQYLGRLAEDEIFDRDEAERYLLLARELPGYDVQLRLIPVQGEIGALIGEVTVQRQPYVLDVSTQNFGSQSVGPYGVQVRAQAFGLLGTGDATSLSYFASSDLSEQHVLQATHQFRPGGEGLSLSGQFTYAWTSPDLGLPDTGAGTALAARTLSVGISARYPLKLAQAETIAVGGGFDMVDQDVRLLVPIARDRLRIAYLRITHDAIDVDRRAPRYRTSAALELRQGLDILGASQSCIDPSCPTDTVNPGRLDGNPKGTTIRANGSAELSLSQQFALVFSARGQASSSGIMGFEEFTAGNYGFGRGYDQGAIIGDHGLGLSAELRLANPPAGPNENVVVQPYAFVDAARAWNEDLTPSQSLYSIGAGARVAVGERVQLDTSLAVPLRRTGLLARTPGVRLLFTLSTRLLPWGARP